MTTRAHVAERLLRTLLSLTLCAPALVGACDDAESRVANGPAAQGGREGLGASAGAGGGSQGNGATNNGGAAASGSVAGSAGDGGTGVGGLAGASGAGGNAGMAGNASGGAGAGMAGNAGSGTAGAGMAGSASTAGTAGAGAEAGKGGSAGTGGNGGLAGNAGTGGAGAGIGGGIAGAGTGGTGSGCSSGETAEVGTTCFLPDGTSVEAWLLSGAAGPWHLHCTELERQPGSPCPPSSSVCTVDACDFHSISATGDPKVVGDTCCYATTVCMGGAGGCGRPLIVNAVARVASLARRADWA